MSNPLTNMLAAFLLVTSSCGGGRPVAALNQPGDPERTEPQAEWDAHCQKRQLEDLKGAALRALVLQPQAYRL